MPRLLRFFRRRSSTKQAPLPSTNEAQADDGHDVRMSFWAHLDELRVRLTRAFLALALGTIAGFFVAPSVFEVLREPYCELVEIADQCQLVVLGPTGGIVAYFRVALLVGGALSIPLVTYQVLMFILPGLTRKEKRMVLMALPAVTLLFVVGLSFAWYVLMRPALGFLEGFQPTLFEPEWTAELYINFVTALLFWMGVAFETPLVFFVLALLGLVSAGSLLRNWRFAIIGSAIAAAFITPTVDPVNMFLVMGPLLALYLVSIVLVFIGRRIAARPNTG